MHRWVGEYRTGWPDFAGQASAATLDTLHGQQDQFVAGPSSWPWACCCTVRFASTTNLPAGRMSKYHILQKLVERRSLCHDQAGRRFHCTQASQMAILLFWPMSCPDPGYVMQAVVNDILKRVDAQGDIYRANYEGKADTDTIHGLWMLQAAQCPELTSCLSNALTTYPLRNGLCQSRRSGRNGPVQDLCNAV